MPPTVNTLDQLYANENSIYDPQRTAIQGQISAATDSGAADIAGLDATKNQAFGQIDQTAASRGALFGGFSPDAQATYLGTKYLPALAQLKAANQQTIQGLNNNLTDLTSQQNKDALTEQQSEQGKLDDYNTQLQSQQFQTQQAQTAYQQEIAKLKLQASLTASSNATNPQDQLRTDVSDLAGELSKSTGSDGYVSPGTYKSAKSAWTALGYPAAQFDSFFAGYRNPSNTAYSLG